MSATRTILCVDDEPDIRRVLSTALRFSLHAEVTAVGSAAEALAYLATHEVPDAIILDGMMPDIDGYEACARLRSNARYAEVPIVFLSAHGSDDSRRRALDAGATVCLTKPFDPMTVGAEIAGALGWQ